MTVIAHRVFPLVIMLVSAPVTAGAQFGGIPGSPGMPGAGFGSPPAGPPPKCQALLATRDELQKHSEAIAAANQKRADVKVACRLFRRYLATEAKMIKMLETDGASCGAPLQVLEQVRSSHAKTQRLGKQVCDAAARGPLPGGPTLYDALGEDLRKPDNEDSCSLCGQTGDFWRPDELKRLRDSR
jgi:hypothetical protein